MLCLGRNVETDVALRRLCPLAPEYVVFRESPNVVKKQAGLHLHLAHLLFSGRIGPANALRLLSPVVEAGA